MMLTPTDAPVWTGILRQLQHALAGRNATLESSSNEESPAKSLASCKLFQPISQHFRRSEKSREARLCLLVSVSLFTAAAAQQPRVFSDADYAQAEKFMPYNVNSLVLHAVENPNWTPDNRVWYRDNGATGTSFILIDPVKKTKGRAFDQVKMAAALKPFARNGAAVDPNHLPIQSFQLSDDDKTVTVSAYGRRLVCDLSGDGVCTAPDQPGAASGGRRRRNGGGIEVSPDGSKAVFIRDWNLFVRDIATGKETQLTTDGVPNYGYATDNAGWTHSDNPILVWSPDSKRIATFQQDQRKTGELYITNVTHGHPTLTVLKNPCPATRM